jgi:phosphoglycerate kinase
MLSLLFPEIIKNQRVFVRADLNVPTQGPTITDDFRLHAVLPTLLLAHQAGASVVLATHRGNPKPENHDPLLSTKLLIPWFESHNIPVVFAATIQEAAQLQSPQHIVLFENLRFFPGEKGHDVAFAQQLATLADVYVNDAFGTIHRNDTSVTLLPQQFPPNLRLIGLLIAREIQGLDRLIHKPEQPFATIIGGAKLDDKVPLITNLLERPHHQRITSCMVGGLPSLAFIKALGHHVGTTHLETSTITQAAHIMDLAQKKGVRIDVPSDVMINEGEIGSTPHGCAADAIPATATVVDIGPATIRQYVYNVAQAHTVFINGTMGIFEYPAYQGGTSAVLQAIAAVNGYTVLGGGDTAAAAAACKLTTSFGFVSSGGGATLAYLGAAHPLEQLPGLKSLISA